MNKFAKTLIALLIFPIVALFSGCQPKPAESAYDIALRHGFIGTEEEWLASLNGDDGKSGDKDSAKSTDTAAKHKPKSEGFLKGVKKFFDDLSR